MKVSRKAFDLIILCSFTIFATIFSFIFNANYFVSTLLFFGLPSVYLSFRRPDIILKASFFSFSSFVLLLIFLDQIAQKDLSWLVPSTIFPFLFMGLTPVENFLQLGFLAYSIILFYENFFLHRKEHILGKNMKYFFYILVPLDIFFITALIVNPDLLHISYAYLWIGIACVFAPVFLMWMYHRNFFKKFILVAGYFFPTLLLSEIVGVKLNQWNFPGEHYLGWVNLFGVRFPIEEFIFWCMFISVAILCYYEYFDEDMK